MTWRAICGRPWWAALYRPTEGADGAWNHTLQVLELCLNVVFTLVGRCRVNGLETCVEILAEPPDFSA
jgi:hypothetical protein